MIISGRPLPNFAKRRSRNSSITPPLRGSRRSRAEWRRLLRWGVRTSSAQWRGLVRRHGFAPANLQAKADPVGGRRRRLRTVEPNGEGFCGGGFAQGEPRARFVRRRGFAPANLQAKADPEGGQRRCPSQGTPAARGRQRQKTLDASFGALLRFRHWSQGARVRARGKRVQFPHGRATVISEFAGEAGHCCFRQWEGSRSGVPAVSQETCLGIDEARCARERLGRTCTQVFRTAHPGISPPSAFPLQPCLPMRA